VTDIFVYTSPADPRARPLVDELTYEYDSRYAEFYDQGGAVKEMERYPPEAFQPPSGAFVLLLRNGVAIAGGAFMRYDAETAEFKRIWTRSDQRRQGLAARVMSELEARAVAQGYSKVYLTTGFRQPEAVGLYLKIGYTALFDTSADPATILKLPFTKELEPQGPLRRQVGRIAS
jgi:GNAT superfamily N-acetyltransferase